MSRRRRRPVPPPVPPDPPGQAPADLLMRWIKASNGEEVEPLPGSEEAQRLEREAQERAVAEQQAAERAVAEETEAHRRELEEQEKAEQEAHEAAQEAALREADTERDSSAAESTAESTGESTGESTDDSAEESTADAAPQDEQAPEAQAEDYDEADDGASEGDPLDEPTEDRSPADAAEETPAAPGFQWSPGVVHPGWSSFARARTAADVLASFDARLAALGQTRDDDGGHNDPEVGAADSETTSEATEVTDQQHGPETGGEHGEGPASDASGPGIAYDDEPWGEESQLSFFGDGPAGDGPAAEGDAAEVDAAEPSSEDATDEGTRSGGPVSLTVREILALRAQGRSIDLPEPEPELEPEPEPVVDAEVDPGPVAVDEAAPATSGDSLAAAYAAADDDGEDDPEATAFYDWTIEDLEAYGEARTAGASEPGDAQDEPGEARDDASDSALAAGVVGATVASGPAVTVPADDQQADDPFGIEGSLDPRVPDETPDETPDEIPAEPFADEAIEERSPDDEHDDRVATTAPEADPEVETDPASVQADDDPDATRLVTLDPAAFGDDADDPDDDEHSGSLGAALAGVAVGGAASRRDDESGAGEAWGDDPPGDQEEQLWYDDQGLRWRSRDGGYIWFADDGQIWNAQAGEVLREATTSKADVMDSPMDEFSGLYAQSGQAEETDPVVEPGLGSRAAMSTDEPPTAAVEPVPGEPASRTDAPTTGFAPPAVTGADAEAAEPKRERRSWRSLTPGGGSDSGPTRTEGALPGYVEYAPSSTRRTLLRVLWAAASVLALVCIFWAVSSGSQASRGVAITVTGLALGSWWLLLSWSPTTVALSKNVLTVTKGNETEAFDLHDPDLDIHVDDDVESKTWKATIRRPDGSDLVIPASSVHPDEFTRIVTHYRSRV